MTTSLLVLIVLTAGFTAGRLFQWFRDAKNIMGSSSPRRGTGVNGS
jgi:hypothetical protein